MSMHLFESGADISLKKVFNNECLQLYSIILIDGTYFVVSRQHCVGGDQCHSTVIITTAGIICLVHILNISCIVYRMFYYT